VLGEYVSHHRGAESARTAASVRTGDHGIRTIARDPPRPSLVPARNRLLAALDAVSYAELLPHLEFVGLPQRLVICEAGGTPAHLYFLVSGIVSLLYESANGSSVEVADAGMDGVVGVEVFTGGGITTTRAVVRNGGNAYRVRADRLKALFDSRPGLREPLLRYAQALLVQATQTAVCHCHHRLEQRFARLLLSTLDRLGSSEFALTQDTMAGLLGVRRESITEVAGRLQAAGLIRYRRGHICVLGRQQLNALVCECYAVVKAAHERLVPQRDAGAHPGLAISRAFQGVAEWSAAIPFEARRNLRVGVARPVTAHVHESASRLHPPAHGPA